MGNPILNPELIVVLQNAKHEEKERYEGDFDEVLKDTTLLVADEFRAFLRGKNNGFSVKRFDSKFVLIKEL